MAKLSYPKWGHVAIAGGVCLTAIEVTGAVGYLAGQGQPNYLVAGGAVVTVLAAILPILAGRCWRAGRWLLAILLWMALVPALSVILVAAVERTGGAKDASDRDRQAHALKLRLAEAAVTEAKAQVDSLKEKADAECSRSKNPKVDPRGKMCTAAEERSDKAAQALKSARDEVVKVGPTPSDPMASRLAAVLPVTEAAISLYQPLVLPLAISITGLLLIASGAHSPRRRKAQTQTRKSKRKKGRAPVSPKPSSAKVIPLRRRS
jgi:uncharacterized membrane protein